MYQFPLNSIGKKIHTLPRCGLVTIQIVRHILCSTSTYFWCGFVCQGVFFLTNAVYTMYHSQNCSFITLLRFEESSISEVLVWQCNIKTMQNPRGLLLTQEVTGSKPVGEECQNQLCSYYCFAHFLIKIQKILDFFFFCF